MGLFSRLSGLGGDDPTRARRVFAPPGVQVNTGGMDDPQQNYLSQPQEGVVTPQARLYDPTPAYPNGATLNQRVMMPSQSGQAQMTDPISQQEKDLVAAPPSAPVVSQHHGSGFLNRLKDALVGTVLMGPLGGIASAINPQMAHNARHELVDQPRYERDVMFNSQVADARTKRAMEIAGVTGYNPFTSEPTFAAGKQAELMDYRQRNLDIKDDLNQIRLLMGNQGDATKRAGQQITREGQRSRQTQNLVNKILHAYDSGMPLSDEDRQFLVAQGVTSAQGAQATKPEGYGGLVTDENGDVTGVVIHPKNPSIPPSVQPVGKGIGKPSSTPDQQTNLTLKLDQQARENAKARVRMPKEPDPKALQRYDILGIHDPAAINPRDIYDQEMKQYEKDLEKARQEELDKLQNKLKRPTLQGRGGQSTTGPKADRTRSPRRPVGGGPVEYPIFKPDGSPGWTTTRPEG